MSPGQPPYHPGMLTKRYLYGYLNGLRRRCQREPEAARNLAVIGLVDSLRRGYKTIANFHKGNRAARKAITKDFILLGQQINLLGGEEVAVDGSFFNGNASKASLYSAQQLDQQLIHLEKKIEAYQQQLTEHDAADEQKGLLGSWVEDENRVDKSAPLKHQQAPKKAWQAQLKAATDSQVSTVDPDARWLSKRGQTTAGYNVRIVVDSPHKLLVAVAVTQAGNATR